MAFAVAHIPALASVLAVSTLFKNMKLNQNGRISTFAPPSAENARVRLKVLSRIVSQLHRSEVLADVAEAKIPPCHFDH